MGCNIECVTNQNGINTKPNIIKKRIKYNNNDEIPTSLLNLKTSSKFSLNLINLNLNKENENNNLNYFEIIEKIEDSFFYKKFKVYHIYSHKYYIMYVIQKIYEINIKPFEKYLNFQEKEIINIINYYEDEYFFYIITDFYMHNIYDFIMFDNKINYFDLKEIFRNILIYFNNYLKKYNTFFPITTFNFSKIFIIPNYNTKTFNVKIELFDIDDIIKENNKYLSINEILYELAKIFLVIVNRDQNKIMKINLLDINTEYDLIDILYNSGGENLLNTEKDLISELINYKGNISNILNLAYFKDDETIETLESFDNNNILINNNAFCKFYLKYSLLTNSFKLLNFNDIFNELNYEYFNNIFNVLLNEQDKNNKDNLINKNNNNKDEKLLNVKIIFSNLKDKINDKYINFEIKEIFRFIDSLNYDFLNFKRFYKCIITYETQIIKNKIKKCFEIYSREKKIDIQYLKDLFQTSNLSNQLKDEINNLISQVDTHKDHNINFNEFLYIIYKFNV